MIGPSRGARLAAGTFAAFIGLAVAVFPGCGRKTVSSATVSPANDPPAAKTGAKSSVSPPRDVPPAPEKIWTLFSGERALAEVRKQVEIGPRPSGSSEIEKARAHITTSLESAGWTVERQEFTDTTPRGEMRFVNLIGRFAVGQARPVPTSTQRALVCSHYDTKRFSSIQFVGANDAGSSTGALIELARVLALDHALAAQIELVFFDGEEALQSFTETDGLYGSRHYARALRDSGRAKQFRFGILWDMIGDKDLTITLSPDSPRELTKAILAAAETLGARDRFTYHVSPIIDDHVPLNNVARIPTIDLIDFDYNPWHTADDTLDKLSAESLQTIAAVTLLHLKNALSK